MKIKGVLSSDFKELNVETGGLVQNTPLFIDHKYCKVIVFGQWVD